MKSKFGKAKTIKIRISKERSDISTLLRDVSECIVDFSNNNNNNNNDNDSNDGNNDNNNNNNDLISIVIHSEQSELILSRVLKILHDNAIEIQDISAVPTNLEDIFLKIMSDDASDN